MDGAAVTRWFTPALPASRIALLRALIYLFVVYDVLVLVNDVVPHAHAPADLYRPLAVERLLHLPAPQPLWAKGLQVFLLVACPLAAAGVAPRVLGWAIALAHLEWVMLGMSYGKVDHDHLALVTALFVLPTAGAVRPDDRTPDEAAGWAIRCIQLTVVATYTLSVWAKFRQGGWDWPTGATFTWAVERKGTFLGRPLLHVPELLTLSQFGVVAMETAAPLVFLLRGRALGAFAGMYLGFHLMTYCLIAIHFLPLVVCWAAFAPTEKWPLPRWWGQTGGGLMPQAGPPPGIRSRLFATRR